MNGGTAAEAGLAAPGARAILVGTGRHLPGSRLPDLPSVDTTLDDLHRVLREVCGMPDEAIHRVPQDADPPTVIAAVERAAADAPGVLLLYYVGHGLLGPGDELYLATHATEDADRVSHAVPYRTVRDLLGDAPGDGVVVLDCCFSGRAAVPAGGRPGEPFAAARPRGSVLLSSASHFALSFAPQGERHTLFSGRLLRLLERGDPAGPPWLTIDRLHTLLEREFEGSPVRPHRQSEGRLGELRVARNRGYRPAPVPAAVPPADVPCPYPGLEPFRAEDSPHFFGREEITARLLDAVGGSVTRPPDRHPVILVGASGVGKSSLLRAGLLAGLERLRETAGSGGPDDVPWPALLLPAPGPRPLRSLAELWAQATGRDTDEVLTAFTDGDGFPEPLPGRGPCRLLVVDQFEEIFTRCRDTEQRARFIGLLTGAAEGRAPRVVLGLRADHYGSCLAHPPLVRALAQGQFTVPPMDEDALRAAIEGPAQAAGLTLEPGLADRLLHDLRHGGVLGPAAAGPDDTAALPFLAHALRETWRTRSGAVLTLAGYQRTGGIWQSVTKTTMELYRSLDEPGRRVLREVLLRMIHLTADGTDTVVRRRVRPAELLDGRSPRQRRLVTEVCDRLANARLITVDRSTAQISHEALLRAWPQLRRWIDEDRTDLLLRQQLAEAADAWRTAGRDPSFLLRGTRLDAAQDLDRRARLRRQPLRRADLVFLVASGAAARAERQRDARRTRRLKQALGGVAVALCLALIAAGVAFQQRRTAQDQRRLATYRALTAEAGNLRQADPQTALRLGLAAYRLRPTAEARKAVFDTLAQTPFGGSAPLPDWRAKEGRHEVAGISPDGRLVATTDYEHGITVWDVRDTARPARTALGRCRDYVDGLAFSRDARLLAAACRDGSVNLWSLADRDRPRRLGTLRLPSLPGSPGTVAFSPDGRTLAAAGWWNDKALGGSLALWSLRDPARPRRLALRAGVYDDSALVFSPDGRTLVSSTSRVTARQEPVDKDSIVHRSGATFWDVADPARPRRLTREDLLHETMAFSPDGRLFAAQSDRTVLLWDLSVPARPRLLASWAAHADMVAALAFSPDGRRLVTGGLDDDVNLWNLDRPSRPQRIRTFSGNTGSVGALAFTPDGRVVVSATDKSVLRWYVTSRGRPTVTATLAPGGALYATAVTPDSRTLATGGVRETVDLWDLIDPTRRRRVASLTGHTKAVRALAISRDGKRLASGGDDGRVLVWDITDPSSPRRVADLAGPGKIISSVGFSPDGATLVATGADTWFSPAQARLWDIARPGRPRDLGGFSGLGTLGGKAHFSADGRLLALPGGSRTGLWDRHGPPKPVALPDGDSTSAFAPDGKTLATGGGYDEAVLLWDVSDAAHPRRVGTAPADDGRSDVRRLAFHPGGNLLAAGGDAGRTVLWDVGDRTRPHLAVVLTGHHDAIGDLAFSPDGRRLITVSGDGTALVWDLGDLPAISADPIRTACDVASGGLTHEQWTDYAPGIAFRRTCP